MVRTAGRWCMGARAPEPTQPTQRVHTSVQTRVLSRSARSLAHAALEGVVAMAGAHSARATRRRRPGGRAEGRSGWSPQRWPLPHRCRQCTHTSTVTSRNARPRQSERRGELRYHPCRCTVSSPQRHRAHSTCRLPAAAAAAAGMASPQAWRLGWAPWLLSWETVGEAMERELPFLPASSPALPRRVARPHHRRPQAPPSTAESVATPRDATRPICA